MLLNPTLKQFVWLLYGYIVIVGVVSFFLVGRELTVIATLAYIPLLVQVYKLQKVRDKSQLNHHTWVIFIIPFILIFWVGISQHQISRKSFVHDKSQLKEIVAVIPETYTDRLAEGYRHTPSLYYLTLQDIRTLKYIELQCAEHKEDYCDRVYDYHGQVATVYYQPNTKYLNLVYEVVVNQQVIYQFDEQLSRFKAQRAEENRALLWLFILYLLPLFFIYRIYKNIIYCAEEMTDEEKQRYDKKRQYLISIQQNIPADGILNIICLLSLMIGMLILFFVFMFILHWLLFASFDDVKKSIFEVLMMFCVSMVFIAMLLYISELSIKNNMLKQKEIQQNMEKPLPHYRVPTEVKPSDVIPMPLPQQNISPKFYQGLIKSIRILLLMIFIPIAGLFLSLAVVSSGKQQWTAMWLFIILLLGSLFVIWRSWRALKK